MADYYCNLSRGSVSKYYPFCNHETAVSQTEGRLTRLSSLLTIMLRLTILHSVTGISGFYSGRFCHDPYSLPRQTEINPTEVLNYFCGAFSVQGTIGFSQI